MSVVEKLMCHRKTKVGVKLTTFDSEIGLCLLRGPTTRLKLDFAPANILRAKKHSPAQKMATSNHMATALLTEHFRYTPLVRIPILYA